MIRMKSVQFTLLIALLMLISACAAPATPGDAAESGQTASTESGEKVLRIAYGAEIDTLNALTSQNLTDIEILMVEGLIMSNDQNTYIPILAKEIPTLENGGVVMNDDGSVTMTWNLHEGVKWHDGEEFTSEDVCFTWDFIVSEAGSAVYNQTEYLNIESCEAPDPYTVVFTWKAPYAPYASLFDTILPKHVLEGQDVLTYDAYNRSPLGTGPFKFVEWKTGEYVQVEKNEDYWRGDPYPNIDGIIVQFIPDPNTRVNALKAGEYDFGQILPNQVKEVEDLAGYKVELVNTNAWVHFDLNIASERGAMLFSDQAVRQALFHAIDREAIARDLMEGTVEVADTGITPNSPYHNSDVMKYDFNPEMARQMLEEAGWTDSDGDGILDKDGESFSFTIINRNSRPERVAIAQVIQANLKDIGVEVTFENLENASWIEKWLSKDWEAVVSGWIIPADPSLTSLYACDASNNFTGFCSDELDAAMEASDMVLEFSDRKPLVDEVQAILAEEAWSLPLHYLVNPFVLREDFQNFKGSGTNLGSYWNSYEWDFGQ
ncbi:MAG: peptide ABC transporter substrate-binding protein [Caldilineaceae bacterium]|nr:peptide ABC transporter substrate-binding protein [Caldilineaceae bacterium]